MDVEEITDRIYLGPYEVAKNEQFIKDKRITVIVNCTKNLENCFPDGIEYYRIPVDDKDTAEENDIFYKYSLQILPRIVELYNAGHNILVHCLAGVQRSASFVSILLCKALDFELDDAISFIQIRKPNTFFFGTRYHFRPALENLYSEEME
jgi:protein-tyrosine phosphatase